MGADHPPHPQIPHHPHPADALSRTRVSVDGLDSTRVPHHMMSEATARPRGGVVSPAVYDAVMPDQTTPGFPDDLVDARRELHEVHAALPTMQADKPWSVVPNEGWDDSDKSIWRPSVRPATKGWTDKEVADYAALQARARELSAFVITHGFWATVAAAERAEARSTLIHVTRPVPAEPTPAA